MSNTRISGIAGLSVFASAIFAAVACGDDRGGFDAVPPGFDPDASAPGDCPFTCSLDGRSVIRSCSGELVSTCAANTACGAGVCQEPCAAAAADRSSNGCDFYFQIPLYDPGQIDQSCYAAFVVNASTEAASVKLEFEGKEVDITKALFRTNPGDATLIRHTGPIEPGQSAVLFLSDRDPAVPHLPYFRWRSACPDGIVPAILAEAGLTTGIASALRVTTNVPVGLSTIYPFGGSKSFMPTANLVLPVPTWGKQHILVNAWEANLSSPGAQLFASVDGTEITILPNRDIQDGPGVKGTRAKVPVTYRLDRGQYLQIAQTDELSGSFVEASHPIAVFGGHGSAFIPSNGGSGDTLHQQIPPFEQWGSEYACVGYRPRTGNDHEPMAYRFVAARDGTRLDYDPAIPPGAPAEMSAGEVATIRTGVGDAFVVRTQDVDHPIYVAAYMSGSASGFDELNFSSHGDPEFVNVVPSGQYLNTYSFYADPTYRDASLVFVRAKSHGVFKDVWLECAGGNLTDFHPIGTRGEYEYARVDLSRNGEGQRFGDHVCQNGLQRTRSEGPFTATIWGWDTAASYAYPGGMAVRKLVQVPLPPLR